MTRKEVFIMTRPDWDMYFMNIAEAVAKRSNCLRPAKGAIIVKDKHIVSTGYNGTPAGTRNCIDGGCERCKNVHEGRVKSGSYTYDETQDSKKTEECACCHAEENAIVHAARHGMSTKGATIYTTFSPCTWCAKMIINAGIVKIVKKEDYPSELGDRLLKEAGIEVVKI
jgi:dCMP deaminase